MARAIRFANTPEQTAYSQSEYGGFFNFGVRRQRVVGQEKCFYARKLIKNLYKVIVLGR